MREWRKNSKVAAVLAALMLVATACGTASAVETDTAAPAASDSPADVRDDSGGDEHDEDKGEGIHVAGHWTIDVYNPDGSLDSAHEFENALTAEGASTLIGLLIGEDVGAGAMGVIICTTGTLGVDCRCDGRVDGDTNLPDEDCVRLLSPRSATREVNPGGGELIRVVASGQSEFDGVMTTVYSTTGAGFAVATVSSPREAGFPETPFTGKVLDTPIPFVAGQQIEITVEISFS